MAGNSCLGDHRPLSNVSICLTSDDPVRPEEHMMNIVVLLTLKECLN
jgi:hypothetical protein